MSNIKDYIFDHLDNLGELERPEFSYLSNNVKEFYGETSEYNSLTLNEKAFLQLSHLFKIISFEDFPKEFDLTEVKIKYINGMLCLVNKYKQLCYEEDGKLYITPLLYDVDAQTYYDISKRIKNNLDMSKKWKCKLYSKDSYDKYNTYASNESCTVALKDAQIVSVLKANGVNYIKDMDLMMQTIELGGRLIESYKEDFTKYISYGFMPVAICKWEDDRAPKAWIKANEFIDDSWKNNYNIKLMVKRHDIIFYIYTNHQLDINFDEWFDKIHYSENYEAAKARQEYIWRKLNNE